MPFSFTIQNSIFISIKKLVIEGGDKVDPQEGPTLPYKFTRYKPCSTTSTI